DVVVDADPIAPSRAVVIRELQEDLRVISIACGSVRIHKINAAIEPAARTVPGQRALGLDLACRLRGNGVEPAHREASHLQGITERKWSEAVRVRVYENVIWLA